MKTLKKAIKKSKIKDTEPNDFTCVLICYDMSMDGVYLYCVPAFEFDGKQGKIYLKCLEEANGTYINTDSQNDNSYWLYDMIMDKGNIYNEDGMQAKTDGPWFKYKLDTSRFNLIPGSCRVFCAGFAP